MTHRHAASACNRFGLGARPGEIASLHDPRAWLLQQLGGDRQAKTFAGLPASTDYLRREYDFQRDRFMEQRAQKRRTTKAVTNNSADEGDAVEQFLMNFRQTFGNDLLAEISARYRAASTSPDSFAERLVRFWSNHFAISIDKRPAALYAAPMEREAIRPHLFGRFSDLLLAVETHPGMLRYLDNTQSIGDNSQFAKQGAPKLARMLGDSDAASRKFGLNENLAREILELHTLGVNGGYSQADVTELARAITGWSTPLRRDFKRGQVDTAFIFRDIAHEPGARSVLGKRYAEDGQAQGRAILADLALHPATAHHLAFKLARHFVADDPPPTLVQRMAHAYRDSDGDLKVLYRSLIESPEAWTNTARKFKTPDDFVVSALRASGVDAGTKPEPLVALLRQLGQPVFMPRSPAGFADTAADWSVPDALWKRVQVAEALAQRIEMLRPDPLRMAQDVLGDALDTETATALRRAESARDGLALFYASPAFQWRT